ncbi:MAG: methyltransferase domain-containing protein [Methanospirillum sp.]|uniref:class I SAM-dependent methyltransferase n=1 Tax=Methanospirillum sp. TaxID=45200 RepID=UPI0023727746|nr:class I SAM-dependent methyltransferase [Methanospirillum sp.]MDD1729778.1 methyltransferase domain-containing protein [Methanospirillum sp.]
MIDITSIDWNEAWKKPEEGEKGKKLFVSCADRWSEKERCEKFNQTVRENNWEASRARIAGMELSPHSRVLDIGAGPGSLAIPLAGIVKEVTAVEPSAAMRECLLANIDEFGITNLNVVAKRWEEVDIAGDLAPPYDVVFASYSLGFPDLREGLLKMDQVSGSYVYIFWFADMLSPWQKNYGDIWEELYGIPFKRYQKPNIIFNLLHQMGIYANVEVIKEDHVQKFVSLDEAVTDQGAGLNLETPGQYAVLRSYLEKKLAFEDGYYTMHSASPRAKIWWKKD